MGKKGCRLRILSDVLPACLVCGFHDGNLGVE